jgi:hypothetical protein
MSQQSKIGKHATKVTKDGTTSTVRYWSTDVVTVNWDTGIITLNTGGWWTTTTKLRMNQASREWGLGYQVYQANFDWFVSIDGEDYNYTLESHSPRGEVFQFATGESQR